MRPPEGSEFVVVDDNSSDDMSAVFTFLNKLSALFSYRVNVIRHSSNRGYGASNTEAVLAARGKYILFVNSDVIVLPGWLSPLLYTMENYPKAGMVGPVMLNAMGRIKEAGGTIFREGTAWSSGYNKEKMSNVPNTHTRVVDYISAACLLARRGVFVDLGLFDKEFQPAYFEDTDAAISFLKEGWYSVLQPFSVVIHEGGGTIASSVSKALQQQHQLLFSRKHKDILSGFCPDINSHCRSWKNKLVPDVYSQYARERTQVLFVTSTVPSESSNNWKDVRVYNIMQVFIKLGFKLSLDVANYTDSEFGAAINHLAEGVFMLPPRPLQHMVVHLNESANLIYNNSSFISHLYRCHFDLIYITGAAAYSRFESLWKSFCKNAIVIVDSYGTSDPTTENTLWGIKNSNKGFLFKSATVWIEKEDFRGIKNAPKVSANIPNISPDNSKSEYKRNNGESISTFTASQRLATLMSQLGVDIPINSTDKRECLGVRAIFGTGYSVTATETLHRSCKTCWYCTMNKYYFRPPDW